MPIVPIVPIVYIGGGGSTNTYKGMNQILDKLDIQAESKTMHHNHFHIDIGRPDIVSLDNLLAQGANTGQAVAYAMGSCRMPHKRSPPR